MGLLHFLRKLKLKEKEMRILFLGIDNAGKSSVIKSFLGESIDNYRQLLGLKSKQLSAMDTD